MMKSNKIIRKRLLPATIAVSCTAPIIFGILAYATLDETKTKPCDTWKEKIALVATPSLFGVISMCFVLLAFIDTYKSNYTFASHCVREYLKKEISEHPEMKTFEKVLYNPRALRSVATMVSNHLRPSEQKLVMTAIDEMIKTEVHTRADQIAAIKVAQKKIIKIIQEHSSVHPYFTDEVYMEMARADTTYVIPAQQQTR